jgi:hypothetical protein
MSGIRPGERKTVTQRVFASVFGIAVFLGSPAIAIENLSQPLTRADCDEAGMHWDDEANVCASNVESAFPLEEGNEKEELVDVTPGPVEAPLFTSEAKAMIPNLRPPGPEEAARPVIREMTNISIDTFNNCPPEGDATSDAKAESNKLKNRWRIPRQFNNSVTLAKMLEPGDDDTRFDSHDPVKVRGFVASVKKSATGESCNCKATDNANTDTHIALGLNSSANATAEENLVIVEVTPRTRFEASLNGLDWSHSNLGHLKGTCVEIEGYLFYDADHKGESRNDAQGEGTNIWRATLWEVHPITSIESINCADLP